MKNEVTIVKVQKLLGLFVVTYRLQGEDFNRVSNRQTMEEVNKTIQELINNIAKSIIPIKIAIKIKTNFFVKIN